MTRKLICRNDHVDSYMLIADHGTYRYRIDTGEELE